MKGRRKATGGKALQLFGCVSLCFTALLAGCHGPGPSLPTVGMTEDEQNEEAKYLADVKRRYENPDAHYQLGRVYHKAGQFARAEGEYIIAVGFDPAHRPAQAAIVRLFTDQANAAKAAKYADDYIKGASVSAEELVRLGSEFHKQALDAYALRCYQMAYQKAPDSYNVNKHLGLYYFDKHDEANAKKYLNRSFELNPRQADVAGALGRLGVIVEVPRELVAPEEKKR